MKILCWSVIVVCLYSSLAANAAAPVVSNVRAAQRAGSKLVDITYDLSSSTSLNYISVAVSTNGGATYDLPAASFTGAVGGNQSPGVNKKISWNAGSDWPGKFSANVRFQITVDDGNSPPATSGMALIPAGTFTMGDNLDGATYAQPTHTVTLSAFYMDKYLVTKAQWDGVYTWAIASGYSFDCVGSGKAADHPVQMINWYDCVKWCNARSQKEGVTPAYYTDAGLTVIYKSGQITNPYVKWNTGYRLPTEAEWEYAARGGLNGKRFPWGDTITHNQANYYSDASYSYDVSATRGYHPNYQAGGYPYTSPVGSFAANGYGLYDMSGNVFEWCWDWDGSYSSGTQIDPRGPASGSGRLCRGGSWGSSAWGCRVVSRYITGPGVCNNAGIIMAFRVVRPPGQ